MWNQEASPKPAPLPQPQSASPALAGRQADERRVVAWVGKSVVFTGQLKSSEDMTIDGHVEGSIELRDHALTIGPDADIKADITAKIVTIFGAVTGTITAREKVDIRETGSVEGDIISPRLAISDGAVLRGRVDTEAREADHKVQRSVPTNLPRA
jgi:cytoskeletal protein CcmA (bactofilin family)